MPHHAAQQSHLKLALGYNLFSNFLFLRKSQKMCHLFRLSNIFFLETPEYVFLVISFSVIKFAAKDFYIKV